MTLTQVVLSVLMLTAAIVSAGCASSSSDPPSKETPASRGMTTAAGVLRGGIMAIGGESTGWRLESGNRALHLDLDISRVRQQAESLQGVKVRAAGVMTTVNYVERGPTEVLVVHTLERLQ